MLVTPEFNGIDLPVLDAGTLVATASDMPNRLNEFTEGGTASSFVRAAKISLLNFSPAYAPCTLKTLLEKTDEELERVAKLCGAEVVRHEWALCAVDAEDPVYTDYLTVNGKDTTIRLPAGHILVAEVDYIPDATSNLSRPQRRKATNGINDYHRAGVGTYQLFDTRLPQLVRQRSRTTTSGTIGVSGKTGDTSTAIWVDIEPQLNLTDERESYLK